MTEEEMVRCIIDSMYMNLNKLWETVKDREDCCSSWGQNESDLTELLNNSSN